MSDPGASAGQRRTDLMRAEQLIIQIGECLRAAVPERFDTEAAPHLKTIRDRIRREIAMLPRPS